MKFDTSNLTIVPEVETWAGVPRRRISYCYLHGKLESDIGYDLFGFQVEQSKLTEDNHYIKPDELEDGIYPCVLDNISHLRDCLFYYWKRARIGEHGGLVVYADDVEANSYARRMYDEKSMTL